jgi:hypothetical protein
MNSSLRIFLVVCILIIQTLIIRWRDWRIKRSQRLINRWAETHQLRIVGKASRSAFRAPLFGRSASGQTVHHITVVDQAGQQRSGSIRCGGRWLGLYSDQVDVRWDE